MEILFRVEIFTNSIEILIIIKIIIYKFSNFIDELIIIDISKGKIDNF